jgi:hypothetical protein
MSLLLEFFIDLWTTAWQADARLHGPSRARWPWVVTGVAIVLLIVVAVFEDQGKLPW